MSTLTEIETAADALPAKEKQDLIYFLVTRLRGSGSEAPPPRDITAERMEGWIADDEAGYRHYLSSEG